MVRRQRWCVPAIILCMAVAGCGTSMPSQTGQLATAVPSTLNTSGCPTASSPAQSKPRAVPREFQVSWVLKCTVQVQELSGRGLWQVTITQRADGPAVSLVKQLQQRSSPPSSQSCPAQRTSIGYFALVDTGDDFVVPTVPTDACGQPLPSVISAFNSLSFHTVSTTPTKMIQSQGAADSNCAESWQNLLASAFYLKDPGPVNIPWADKIKTLNICTYSTEGSSDATGTFVAAYSLTGAKLAALLTDLRNATPAAPCTLVAGKFAVLLTPDNQWIFVELDGCTRMLNSSNVLSQLTSNIIHKLNTR